MREIKEKGRGMWEGWGGKYDMEWEENERGGKCGKLDNSADLCSFSR